MQSKDSSCQYSVRECLLIENNELVISDNTQIQPIKFPHFASVYTNISNCRVGKFHDRLKATSTGLGLSECINKTEMMITRTMHSNNL